MKIRNGFVTNSSSSSYVIAFKNKFQKEEDTQSELITSYNHILNSIFPKEDTYSSVEELNSKFIDSYAYRNIDTLEKILEDDEYLKEKYEELKKNIENGYSICEISLEYEDEVFSNMIYKLCKNENFIMIDDGN